MVQSKETAETDTHYKWPGWGEDTERLFILKSLGENPSDHDACCLSPLCVGGRWAERAGGCRAGGWTTVVDTWSHLVSLPSCALSLSYKHWRVRCFTFTSPSHSRPAQPVLTLVRMLWPGIVFKLILCRQTTRPPSGFDWIIFCVSASNIVLHVGLSCLPRSKLLVRRISLSNSQPIKPIVMTVWTGRAIQSSPPPDLISAN